MSLTIRRARPGEAGLVLSFVRELAEYEKLLHEVEATEADIDAALFCNNPRLFCEIAEWNDEPAGFAVWFINFRPSAAAPAFIWKTCSSARRSAARALARRCWCISRNNALRMAGRDCNGRCWTGMRRRLNSTSRSALS
jgi:hypothetical protein